MKKDLFYFYLLLSVFIIPLIGCNTIPDGVKQNSSNLIQNQVEKNYKIDTIFIFNCTKGHSADFKGNRIIKLTENGHTTSQTDSMYARITCLGDTILELADSTYGLVEFQMADVMLWDSLFSKIKYRNGLIGVIVSEYLNPDDLQTIDSTDSSQFSLLSVSTKKSVITALNDILNVNDLYFNYRVEIEDDVFYIPVMDSLYADILRLVGENVFLDTTGWVQSNLSFSRQEKLKWFNWRIFTKYLDNEANAVDNGKIFKKYSTVGRVYTFRIQSWSAQNEQLKSDAIRFISKRSDGLYQIAFEDASGFFTPDDNKITGFPFTCDIGWTVTPFSWFTTAPFLPTQPVTSLSVTGKATMKYSSFLIDSDTTWHYDLRLMYPISGTIMQNDEPLRIAGTYNTAFGFYKISSMYLDPHQGYFTRWDGDMEILATSVDGNIIKYRESYFLHSDDGPNGEYF